MEEGKLGIANISLFTVVWSSANNQANLLQAEPAIFDIYKTINIWVKGPKVLKVHDLQDRQDLIHK